MYYNTLMSFRSTRPCPRTVPAGSVHPMPARLKRLGDCCPSEPQPRRRRGPDRRRKKAGRYSTVHAMLPPTFHCDSFAGFTTNCSHFTEVMKKYLILIALFSSAHSALCQGTTVFVASLSGANESPENNSIYSGIASFTLTGMSLDYVIQTGPFNVSGSATITGPGLSGPILFSTDQGPTLVTGDPPVKPNRRDRYGSGPRGHGKEREQAKNPEVKLERGGTTSGNPT